MCFFAWIGQRGFGMGVIFWGCQSRLDGVDLMFFFGCGISIGWSGFDGVSEAEAAGSRLDEVDSMAGDQDVVDLMEGDCIPYSIHGMDMVFLWCLWGYRIDLMEWI